MYRNNGLRGPQLAMSADGSAAVAWDVLIYFGTSTFVKASNYVPESGWSASTDLSSGTAHAALSRIVSARGLGWLAQSEVELAAPRHES